MPHAISDADWPWVRWLIKEAKAGRLGKTPPPADALGKRGGKPVYVGQALTKIKKGQWGWIRRVRGKPAVGEVEPIGGRAAPTRKPSTEKPTGRPMLAYCHYGTVRPDGRVQYVRHNGYVEIIQSPC